MKLMALSVVAVLLCGSLRLLAQNLVVPQQFEVASIRQNLNIGAGQQFGATPSGYRATNTVLVVSILLAYPPSSGQVLYPQSQVLGLPAWAGAEHYDIEARIAPEQLSDWQTPAIQQKQLPELLRNLLAERCKLQAHREQKETASFSLVVAKGGPKFAESKPDAALPAGVTLPGGGVMVSESNGTVIHFYHVPVSTLATVLTHMSGKPVVDRTGLQGYYDILFERGEQYERDGLSNWSFEAISRLGLKLVAQKNTVEFLVIDHLDRPSQN